MKIRYRDPCSASINEDDLHTTKLIGDQQRKVSRRRNAKLHCNSIFHVLLLLLFWFFPHAQAHIQFESSTSSGCIRHRNIYVTESLHRNHHRLPVENCAHSFHSFFAKCAYVRFLCSPRIILLLTMPPKHVIQEAINRLKSQLEKITIIIN